jgi:NAD(P)-dependent dehydrogenase (short-subunit alcohol dehydrogenase family)
MSQLEVLRGGVAVITGAGSGIGEGLAHAAAAAGMQVVLADVAADRIERVAGAIRASGGSAHPIPTDVADPASIERLAAAVHARFGDVRLLANNAGIETLGFTWDLPAESWERIIRINVLGVIHGVRVFAPRMLAAGQRAFVANTASIGALGMMPVQTPYVLSKHAVLSFSECLRMEMDAKRAPISVSAVLPGPVATRIFDDAALGRDAASVMTHRGVMQKMVGGGLSGREAADRILAGVAAGEFWVSTHPELTAQMAKQRAEYLATQATPALNEAARAML